MVACRRQMIEFCGARTRGLASVPLLAFHDSSLAVLTKRLDLRLAFVSFSVHVTGPLMVLLKSLGFDGELPGART